MTAVTGQLAAAAIVDATTTILAALAALLIFRYRVNPSWLILGGALVGVAAAFA
jgi:chromate transporter